MEYKMSLIKEFKQKLKRSGYSWEQTQEILICGLTGFENQVARAEKNGHPLHRSNLQSTQDRIEKKLTEKQNWFKSKPRLSELRRLGNSGSLSLRGKILQSKENPPQ